MMRFFKITLITSFCLLALVACKKDDEAEPTPVTPFATQEPVDFAKMETFLDTYSMSVSSNYDVTFTPIPTPNPANLVNIRTQFAANLKLKTATVGDVSHRFYFIELREGTQMAPTKVDSVFVSYRGRLLDNTTFDEAQNPIWLNSFFINPNGQILSVVQGWREVLPQFKTGTFTEGLGGTVDYQNFGAGVMFLPSALGYYNQGSGAIPAYAPLIFNFKLMHLNYVDHDQDRIDSRFEDINGDGQFVNDDTDGDGRPDYLDQDDDGDSFLTKFEIKNPAGGYFDFANIPLCNGKKKHLTTSVCN